MAGRGRNATLPSWLTKSSNSTDSNGRIEHETLGSNNSVGRDSRRQEEVVDRAISHSNSNQSKDNMNRQDAPRLRGKSRSPERKVRSRSRNKRSRSRDRRENRSLSATKDKNQRDSSPSPENVKEWKPKKTRSSNFDVKPPDGIELPVVGISSTLINPASDPHLRSVVERYLGSANTQANGDNSFTMQQTKHARRLYVGGITPDTSEDELGNFISDLITKSVDCAWDDNRNAVLQVYINREKCFAFVELKSIELTTASIAFDGIKFTNHNGLASTLRIRRPNDFKPELMPTQLRPIPTVNLSKIGVVCGNVSDGPEKVFVGGLPYQLSDDDVKELLSAFGPLKSFHLVRDAGSMTSKGYGFCEYLDSYTTNAAIAGLNGMTIGEKTLTVRLAAQTTPGFQIGSSQMLYQTPSQTSAFPQLSDVGSIRTPTDQYSQPGYTLSHLNLASTIPTRILKLGQMVTSYELADDQEYYDILEDVKLECQPFGEVIRVVIPRVKEGFPPSSEGNIFVEFSHPDMARRAASSLIGRKFADRTVTVEYFDETMFSNRRLY